MKKNKILKMFLISIVILILLWCSMFTTDIVLSTCFNRKPVFASVDTNSIQKDGGSARYKGLGYSIQTKVRLSITNRELFNIYYVEVKIVGITIYKHNLHS